MLLGFVYEVEFAQAVFLLAAPMTLVGVLSLRAAVKISVLDLTGKDLHRKLTRHRMTIQGIGMVSIFVTALWGMWQNLQLSVY